MAQRGAIAGEFDELAAHLGLPFIVKPRQSYASKGLVRVHDREDFHYAQRRLGDNLLAQRVVGDPDSEFTTSLFGYGDGSCSSKMVFQRWLAQDGSTARARVVHEPSLEAEMDRLTRALRPLGPTNFQFRKHDGRWYLLEINARISSSTSLKRAFGMNEAEMCIAYYLDGERPDFEAPRAGTAIRYIEDWVFHDRADF